MTNGNKIDVILRTKLYRPPVPKDHVHRPRLLEYLDQRRDRPLTLVSAPAGYGKSVLISCWLETLDIPHTWLSLDEHDSDLRQFLLYFLTAIQTLFPDAARDTTKLANASPLPSVPVLARSLANELDAIEQNFILMLDDLHRIQGKPVHDFLTELLQYPPRPMHLVLATRSDPGLPLASYRAKNLVTEVRLFDLRFTSNETAVYLEAELGKQIKKEITALLAKRADGWITGLRLAVLAMRRHDNMIGKLLELKGTTVHVTEYLINEVLDAQLPTVRQYLLSTCILNRFCASLCDALWVKDSGKGQDVIDGATFIAKLQKDNLFLISLDIENRWFRYHHLFQKLLLSRLKKRCTPEEIARLHSRAGKWYTENNFIDDGIQHDLLAGNVNRAVRLFGQNRMLMLNNNQWFVFEKWLPIFPDKVIEQEPELQLAQVWVHYFQCRYTLIPAILDSVESLLNADPENQSLYGEIYLFKGVYCFMRGDPQGFEYIKKAIKKIPVTNPMVRGFAEIYFGLLGQMEGRKEKVVQELSKLILDPSLDVSRKLRILLSLVWIHLISGELSMAGRFNRQLARAAAHYDVAVFIAWNNYNQGVIHFCRNELDLAIHHFSQATENKYLMLRRANVDCMIGLALAYQATHQGDKATTVLENLNELIRPFGDPTLSDLALSCRARLSLMRGETAFVTNVLDMKKSRTDAMAMWLEVPIITQLRTLACQGPGNCLPDVEKKLNELLSLNQAHHNTFQIIGIMVIQTLAIHRQGRLDDSLDLLGQALEMAKPDKFIQPFIETAPFISSLLKRLQKRDRDTGYIEKIIAVFNDGIQIIDPEAPDHISTFADKPFGPSIASQPLVESLTNRELEILMLVAKLLQNKEIADKLFISLETVKSHLKNTYQKLNVRNRREAVSKARNLGILDRR